MAYIIPNANQIGGGLKYVNINQAEPDALDIEALGLRNNWVRSGGTTTVAGGALSVSAGSVVIGGVPYSFSARSSITPVAAANARFDVIVARLNGSSVSVVVVKGTDSGTNPTLPASRSVLAGGYDSLYNVDPATDVLLAAVYVDAGTIVSGNVVDKRIINTQAVTRTGTSVPTDQTYDVLGDVVIYNGIQYVKTTSTVWTPLASRAFVENTLVPIGSVFAWAGVAIYGLGGSYLSCSGQSLNKADYPELYTALTVTNSPVTGASIPCPYGETTLTFNLPNMNSAGRTIVGSTFGDVGTIGGSNTVSLAEANIPQHKHNVSVGNHTSLVHDSVDRASAGGGVSNFMTKAAGAHYHTTQTHTHIGALVYRPYNSHNGYHIGQDTSHSTDAFHVDALQVNEENPGNPYTTTETDAQENNEELRFISTSAPDTNSGVPVNHQHSFALESHSISAHTVNEANFGQATPTPVNVQNRYINMRWYMRVA